MTPTQLATLARAMGYDVEIDATGGYGVTRVLLCEKTTTTYEVGSSEPIVDYIHKTVFRPHEDAAQAWEVLAWLMRAANSNAFRHGSVDLRPLSLVIGISITGDEGCAIYFDHDGTAAGIRRAIVEAAVMVAEAAD